MWPAALWPVARRIPEDLSLEDSWPAPRLRLRAALSQPGLWADVVQCCGQAAWLGSPGGQGRIMDGSDPLADGSIKCGRFFFSFYFFSFSFLFCFPVF